MKKTSYVQTKLFLGCIWFVIQTACSTLAGTNGWISQDIGSGTRTPGTAVVDGTGTEAVFTLTGQGYIYGAVDSGQFYYQMPSGDVTLVARVISQSGAASSSAKAGVMIRAKVDGHAANVFMAMTNSNGAACQVRLTDGDATTTSPLAAPYPQWVKVVRKGSEISGYISTNGKDWTRLGAPITMKDWPEQICLGLAATSNGPDVVTAKFDNVTLTPGAQ